jgi:hypothetical protein
VKPNNEKKRQGISNTPYKNKIAKKGFKINDFERARNMTMREAQKFMRHGAYVEYDGLKSYKIKNILVKFNDKKIFEYSALIIYCGDRKGIENAKTTRRMKRVNIEKLSRLYERNYNTNKRRVSRNELHTKKSDA